MIGGMSAIALAAMSLQAVDAAPTSQVATTPDTPQAESSDEIIVRGLRLPRDELPTQVHWNYPTMLQSRIDYQEAMQLMRCAARLSDLPSLRKVVDGAPGGAVQRYAQGLVVQKSAGCYPPNRGVASGYQVAPTSIADRGASRSDRVALIEMVIATYAPSAELAPEDVADRAVRARFQEREGPRNRLRLANDQQAFRSANCLVQDQPVLATRLVRATPGSELERGLVQAILIDGRGCLGPVRRLTIDQINLRLYIVDAFYRWVVAARGVDSLIPADAAD